MITVPLKIHTVISSTILSASSLMLLSCAAPTVGDQLTNHPDGAAKALGGEWNRADKLVNEGEDMVKKGKKLVAKGNDQIGEGELLKSQTESAARKSGFLKGSQ